MNHKRIFFLLTTLLILSFACRSFTVTFNTDNDENKILLTPQVEDSNDDELESPVTETVTSGDGSKGGGQFPDADEVVANPSNTNIITSPSGEIYSQVQIKAGPDIFVITQDINNGCFEVSGIGTSTVMVNRIGDGPDCKHIGGIGLFYDN